MGRVEITWILRNFYGRRSQKSEFYDGSVRKEAKKTVFFVLNI